MTDDTRKRATATPELEAFIAAQQKAASPPPLRPFGLVLHHDGRWTHEGQPILNRKLREKFDVSVVYLPEEPKHVVRLGRFRGEIEVEEAGFFVRDIDLESGSIHLSDGSQEPLAPETLTTSPIDGAFLCRIKRSLVPEGVLARFTHAAHAELLTAVEERGSRSDPDAAPGYVLRMAGAAHPLPAL